MCRRMDTKSGKANCTSRVGVHRARRQRRRSRYRFQKMAARSGGHYNYTLFWKVQLIEICAFQLQQEIFFVQPARIACQSAVCSDNAVTWNDNGNGIMADCSAHGLCRACFCAYVTVLP